MAVLSWPLFNGLFGVCPFRSTIVRDNTHERNSKRSLIWQIIEGLLRQKRVDSAFRK